MNAATPVALLNEAEAGAQAPTLAARLALLGPPYTQVVQPAPLPLAERLVSNDALAHRLGLHGPWWHSGEATERLAGNQAWPGYAPRASVYAGHQFGSYTRQLGDGRALLIAELDTPEGPIELQLKGAGPTPYARGSDGRAALRSSIREYLASEALHALGVPTTRALALVGSPLLIQRERPEPAAVLARTAPSFLRFGHFEYYAHSQQYEGLAVLADHVIVHHHPHLADISDTSERHAQWLAEVLTRQAQLIAQWQTLGFCHGVINTDNCSILGLTLDYGPYGFMERFRAHHVCNHSDTEGRYAYQAQPAIGQWNCARLLEACLSLLHDEPEAAAERARTLLPVYERAYNAAVMQRWRAKLGLAQVQPGDATLINRLLTLMQQSRCDFTLTFRALADQPLASVRSRFAEPAALDAWWADWQQRAAAEGVGPAELRARMLRVNPKFVLRNHLAQAAIEGAERGDVSELLGLLKVLQTPFDEHAAGARYAAPAPASAPEIEVSCSA
jgi:uncharacterized protein YdiU (UPF0061 family)